MELNNNVHISCAFYNLISVLKQLVESGKLIMGECAAAVGPSWLYK